jgi:hypothetical protein
MSTPAHGHSHTVQEPGDLEDKNLPYRKIVGVGVAALLTFGLSILWSTSLLHGAEKEMQPAGPPPLPPGVNQYEVGIVNQRMFSLDQRAAQKRLQQMTRLNTYGWLDKQTGIVHIPVDVAMDMLVQGQKK